MDDGQRQRIERPRGYPPRHGQGQRHVGRHGELRPNNDGTGVGQQPRGQPGLAAAADLARQQHDPDLPRRQPEPLGSGLVAAAGERPPFDKLRTGLGGANVTANSSGAQISKLLWCAASRRDKPCPLRYATGVLREGETRYTTGTTPTTWRFTGQREDATIGLYFYNARYLDPALGRFTQPDTIVPAPGNPQSHPRTGPRMHE